MKLTNPLTDTTKMKRELDYPDRSKSLKAAELITSSFINRKHEAQMVLWVHSTRTQGVKSILHTLFCKTEAERETLQLHPVKTILSYWLKPEDCVSINENYSKISFISKTARFIHKIIASKIQQWIKRAACLGQVGFVPSRKSVHCLKVNGSDKVMSLAKGERAHDHVN